MQPDIRLESLRMEHADGYIALLSDPGTAPYISESGLLTREAALAKLQQITVQNFASSVQAYFAIVGTVSGEFLGYVAAHNLHADICPISYAVLPAHRRRGIVKAAIRLLLNHLSQHSIIECIEAKIHPENTASQAALQACGFHHYALASPQTGQRDIFRRKR